MLRATDISRRIGQKVLLNNCSLTLTPGRFTAVVGPNGAGKSTLLRIVSGEDQPDRGQVHLNGRLLANHSSRELSQVRAVLPQHTTVNFPFTVEQVIEVGRFAHRTSDQENQLIISEVMRLTGLVPFQGRAYQTLSGGEQQRVQMARVMAQLGGETYRGALSQPRYLLLDEPTSSLDLAQQQRLLGLAKDLCLRPFGLLAILHDLNLAIQYADDILFLKQGETIAYGAVEEVVTQAIVEETFSHPEQRLAVRLIRDQRQLIVVPKLQPRHNKEETLINANKQHYESHP
ncbi:heme ABC transporter ATP-binding protein [Tunicatimonas pelagia]|uniref:heme ABC transporter ATP-binding protein n=1 Tax=Tunicatimonas pelagia TaxID=931531 RepID=UPI002664EA22|nr:heme ABC transporter ATP-binding protein [Tunicatimonas pelagia]WKN43019.1 heme ABC transporter ATP-binding protein [Tunicatimonas pelagia]